MDSFPCCSPVIVETLLLLLWRHLFHYLSESLQDGPSSSWATILPSSVSLRFSQGPGATQDLLSSKRGGVLGGKEMWDEASRELGPSLGRLEGVDLVRTFEPMVTVPFGTDFDHLLLLTVDRSLRVRRSNQAELPRYPHSPASRT